MSDELKHSVEPPTGPQEMDPAEVEALLAQADAQGETLDSEEALGGADYLAEEAPLGQVDAEGLLVQATAAVELPAAAMPVEPSADAVPVDELDFDAVLFATPEKYLTPPVEEAPVAAAAEAAIADEPAPAPMPQETIDAVIAAAMTPPPAPSVDEVPATAPDSEVESTPAPVESAGDQLLDQEELDNLLKMMDAPEESDAPPARETAPGRVTLDQSELDALVEGMMDEAPLAGGDMDAPVLGAAAGEAVSLSQENVDALLGSLAEAPVAAPAAVPAAEPVLVPAPAAAPQPPAAAPADISQDMIDALIAAAAAPSNEIGNENLAAAATAATQAPMATVAVEHDDLDHLIEESRRRERMQRMEAATGPAPTPPRARRMPSVESPLAAFLKEHGARAVASIAAGLLVAGATFFWLYSQPTRTPNLAQLAVQRGSALEEAMDAARKMIEEGEYLRAVELLGGKIEDAPAGRERTDAVFLRAEALYKSVPANAPLSRYDEVQSELDNVLAQAPDHPRIPDALHWKALLHERGELPFAALDNYELIVTQHPGANHMDEILVEAARLALALGVPEKAARYADQAVQQFPASPHVSEAKLLQGDAYAKTGQRDAARKLYAESFQGDSTSPLGVEAVLRLGRLSFDEGDFEGAISQIRDYLSKSTIPEGNDAAYLLLAQALRKTKRDAEAREVLNDLLRFFPNSKHAPEAYVEFSQTLESLGERQAALQIAREGEGRFPADPRVLKNLGELLGLDGNPFSAATTLIAADLAGADDPAALLTAARHFRTAGILEQAQATYSKLLEEYGGSPESFVGGVELAELIYDRGDAKRALDRLEKIATATEGTPRQLPALLAMAKIFDAIGLPGRVAEVSEKAAGLTDDPAILAQSAAALIKAGELTEGQKIAERIDYAQVPADIAYTLLSALGTALLKVDPPRGIEKLEEAYADYPAARRAENDFALVEAYLGAERAAGARRIVLDLAARAKARPEDTPYLVDAGTLWGDYLYEKGDYRAAADAYALADDASNATSTQPVDGKRTDRRWPRYQRANSLLKLSDFAGSLALYDEIAQTDAPWAKEAAVKADYVRMQQRLRGESSANELAGAAQPAPAA